MKKYEIRWVYNHYEIYHNGKFLCSCDNQKEVEKELEEAEGK